MIEDEINFEEIEMSVNTEEIYDRNKVTSEIFLSATYHFSNDISKKIFNNTYNYVIKNIKNTIDELLNTLPFGRTHIKDSTLKSLIERIEQEQSILNIIYDNSNANDQFKNDNQFLSTLYEQQKIVIENKKEYFEQLGKGLLYGYALEIILKNIDRNLKKILKGTKTNLTYLNQKSYLKEINTIELILSLIDKKVYENYVRYIYIGIELDLTLDQVKRYTRVNNEKDKNDKNKKCINQKSFEKHYDYLNKIVIQLKDSNIL